ncbi:MAG: M28 family peptidase [Planctomycetes bacterium]|nr:M28 family peptidase [Planctomycetota bacterium]
MPGAPVIARAGPPRGARLVVGAHYDAAEPGIGADDNASGVAGLWSAQAIPEALCAPRSNLGPRRSWPSVVKGFVRPSRSPGAVFLRRRSPCAIPSFSPSRWCSSASLRWWPRLPRPRADRPSTTPWRGPRSFGPAKAPRARRTRSPTTRGSRSARSRWTRGRTPARWCASRTRGGRR